MHRVFSKSKSPTGNSVVPDHFRGTMSNLRVVGWWLRVVGLWMMMWRCLSLVAPPIADRVSPSRVKVYDDAEAVGAAVCRLVDDAAAAAVEEKGKFVIGIPGGSVLKMLAGSQQPTWSKATTVVWVNHKCVDVSDPALSTRAKATFLEQWPGAHVLDLTGTNDADAEADLYEAKLREAVPVDDQGLPKFDMMLIGAGDDGHIGSLYPDRAEVLRADRWVLPVKMKDPPSITLSLPVMRIPRANLTP